MYKFQNIIGNGHIINSLITSNKNDTVLHAYILDGKEKSGKQLISKTFAKLLLCENSKTEPCLKCSSCISFESGNNPDFFFIESDKKNLGISDIRDKIIKNIETKPFKYKYKVFIIKDAHNMTFQAQNALLKTLEEPPSFVIIILLSKNYKSFLPTILSRCILFRIKPLSPNLIEKFLITNGINETIAKFYATYSRGSIGRAFDIAHSEKFFAFRQDIINDVEKLDGLDLIQMYNLIDKYENMKENIFEILDIYLLVYRDSLIFKYSKNFDNIIQKDIKKNVEDISNMSIKNLVNKIDALLKAKMYLEQNSNFNMVMECLFLRLKEK
ncbi:DNA polymerase III subunit [[Clostridium] colinum]|uniref:DNA polymerase III subunit n=1 Tax=[Clostridium] colinum TaxID=36835 RepID=UPI002023E49B|nr:DNA polymerase III subunit delta' C-terminal domain-containing protein [[Clostridium] colinum]